MPTINQLVRIALVYMVWPTGHWAQDGCSSDWTMTKGQVVVTVHATGDIDISGFPAGVVSTLLGMQTSDYVDNHSSLVAMYNSGELILP